MPMVFPAPGRFSTTNGCPSCCDTCSNTARAMMSVAAPAVSGMITRMGRVGHSCADAPVSTDAKPKNPIDRLTAASTTRRMDNLPVFVAPSLAWSTRGAIGGPACRCPIGLRGCRRRPAAFLSQRLEARREPLRRHLDDVEQLAIQERVAFGHADRRIRGRGRFELGKQNRTDPRGEHAAGVDSVALRHAAQRQAKLLLAD